MCVDPIAWWWIHDSQFPNVAFLAKQILRIPVSQIETGRVLGFVGVLTALRCCPLQVENLDRIIIMVKNQPNDRHMNCTANAGFKDYMKYEVVLVEENYVCIEESEYLKIYWLIND